MTKKEMFVALDGIIDDSAIENKTEAHEFIAHEIDLLSRRSTSNKPTATQIANEAIKTEILNTLTEVGPVTISELQSKDEYLNNYSNQKVNSLITQLVDKGLVKREVIKKRAYFSIAVND